MVICMIKKLFEFLFSLILTFIMIGIVIFFLFPDWVVFYKNILFSLSKVSLIALIPIAVIGLIISIYNFLRVGKDEVRTNPELRAKIRDRMVKPFIIDIIALYFILSLYLSYLLFNIRF